MKKNTFKWIFFKYNLILIIILISLIAISFNITISLYLKKDIINQLNKMALSAEFTALQHGPEFLPPPEKMPAPPRERNQLLEYYFILDHSLKQSLTVLNADFILLDKFNNHITPYPEQHYTSNEVLEKITKKITETKDLSNDSFLNFHITNVEYVAIIKPVYDRNSFGLGWVVIYSSLEKINQLKLQIYIILFVILIICALITIIYSSFVSRKISAPLQNVSHEFRTPLMSILSYAEGIKYEVVNSTVAADIIIDESIRMTHLVEDIMYLSRLDIVEENYTYNNFEFNDLLNICIKRMNGIAMKNNIMLLTNESNESVMIYADEEKLIRAITNIINNCIRYASTSIKISSNISNNKIVLTIADDGKGFEAKDLPNIFHRFYKGKKGNYGLGLSISKNIIEKHNGKIYARNSSSGALFIIELPIIQLH